ncbi:MULTISPECIES: hypothetical protein [unclassified Streptomyces]|uniref:hypothetical protein n=1 Tax=unclassified Streptomyces TaxID=2593676 RepID=UPI002365D5D7|nr:MULTISPECIES: hypothetical protein [unclassified Streptomyces]MDF3145265.1 hypothetical protein [Streptomyces sp. T21Q-yed]WDF35936.1 hypothetical protein PBV52_03615 [Streptomyces sp. T12]
MQAPHIHPTADRPHPAAVLKRRWPTALALVVVTLNVIASGSEDVADAVGGFGETLPLLPLIYLVVHQTGKPQATWPVLGAGLVAVFALPLQDVVAPSTVLVALALVLLAWGAVRGTPHGRATFGAQAVGALVFCGLASAGLAVDPDLGRYLVAAGWFFHGVWDFVHLRLDKVVSRTFAEWCGVIDVLVAVQLLFLV